MTDLSKMSLEDMEKEGILDKQIPISSSNIKNVDTNASILSALPTVMKIGLSILLLILIFGIINIPLYFYWFIFN